MIRNFVEHAANERTFLAWIRTAIAIIGVGIILEKIGAPANAPNKMSLAGVLLLVFGMLMILGAGVRFLLLRRLIRANREAEEMPVFLDIALAIILLVLVATLVSFGTNLFQTF